MSMRLPAPGADQPSRHVFEQGLQAAGEIGRPEEAVRVPVDGRNPRQLRGRQAEVPSDQMAGQRAEVERENVLGELLQEHVGVQVHAFESGAVRRFHRS